MRAVAACVRWIVALAVLSGAPQARAESGYPARPITIVVPFAPGGAADVIARRIGPRLSTALGQSVVVENRPGMGGNIGAEAVAKSAPDGYTLVLGTVGIHAAYQVYGKLRYDPAKDLQPVVVLGEVPCAVVVHPSVPVRSLKELLAYAKGHPGKLTFGSAGNGSSTHMVGELFRLATKVDLTHVPYRGSAPAMNDLLGGQIDMMFELVSTAAPQIKSGRILALGVTSAKRTPALPDVAPVAEQGVPGFQGTGWFTVAAPAQVPKDIISRLNREINEILSAPDMQATWRDLGMSVIGGSSAAASKFFESETRKWGEVIRAANIHVD